jgi:23S rRNA pseudouridine1911/1915/1917 synthase
MPNSTAPEVLWEDNHLLALNKPAGWLVQPDPSEAFALEQWAERWVAKRAGKPKAFIGVPHRLDRPTSGLVLLAKTSKALARLNQAFHDRTVTKTYWAVVEGCPSAPEARLEHRLARDGKNNKSFVSKLPDAQQAVLHYRIVTKGDRYTLVEVDLETGRHHQIRVQLAAIGHPIKGDLKYGAKRSNPDGSIHLHARRVELAHPVGGAPLVVVAPLPKEALWQALAPADSSKD